MGELSVAILVSIAIILLLLILLCLGSVYDLLQMVLQELKKQNEKREPTNPQEKH